jgi:hypothetical protein
MPRYVVTMPDGKKYAINGPAGASQAEVIAAVQRRIGAAEKEETTLGGELKEAAKGIIPGAAGLLETAATGAAALLPEEQEMAVRAKAAELAGAAREEFAAAPGYEKSIGRKFGEALGSTAPIFALGPLGAAGRAAAMGLGVGAGAGEARQRAEMEGGEEEKGLATVGGAFVGATEAIPVFNFVKRLPRNAQLSILDRVKRGFQAAGEEGAQEAANQVAQNLIARGLYKPSQELLESAGEEGAYGAGVGAFIQVLTDMALGRRVRGVQPPQTTEEKFTQPETPPAAPPGTQAAVQEEVSKQADIKDTVEKVISDEEDAQEEARREREAIQAYEREREAEERALYDAQTLREAAEAEALAPVDEDVPYMPPAEKVAEEPTLKGLPDRISERIISSNAGSDFVKDLYSPNPTDAVLTSFEDLNTVTPKEINQSKEYIKSISQNLLRNEFGDEVTLYRGLKGTEEKSPVLSYTLNEDVARFQATQQGIRTGKIEEIKVPVSEVLSYSEAIGRGTFAEDEVIIPANARAKYLTEPTPAVEEPEYTMRDAALEVFKQTGKTNVDTLRDRLAIPLQEAKALRQSLIDEGLLVRRGNTYILQEVETAPPAKAEEVEDAAAIRPRDIETPDLGAVGRGDVLPPSQPVSAGLEAAEPAVAGVERVGKPAAVVDEGAAGVEPTLEDVEIEDPAARAKSIRRAALDFVRATGKADPISLQQALGIGLTDAKRLRDALVGSGAIVPRGKNRYSVFEQMRPTATEAPFRAGRIEGESLSAAKPEVLQAPAVTAEKKELPFDAAAETTAVAQAQKRREDVRKEVDQIKADLNSLRDTEGTQQFGLDLTSGVAGTRTVKKLTPAEVNVATSLGVNREAVAYSADPEKPATRRALIEALRAKRKEIAARAAALRDAEISNRINRRETTFKDSFFRNLYGSLRDPQISLKKLLAVDTRLKEAENKLKGVAPEAAPEQERIEEDQKQFAEAVERAKEREAAEKEARKVRRLGRKREIGLRFERGKGAGMDADLVYDIATKVAANWKNPPRIFVVQSISELPDTLRDRVPSDATGFYINGDVFLIADNASNEAGVKSTLFHESLGHYGLKTLFGRRLREVMLNIYRTNPAMRKSVDKWLKRNPDTYNNLGRDNELAMAVEEVFAESSTQGVIKDVGIRAAFNRVAALIRKFLRGMGFQINYSNNDIRQILIEAHDSVTTRARQQRLGDGSIAFERKKAEARLSNVFDVNTTAPRYDNKIGDGVRSSLGNVYDNLRDGAISFFSIPQIAEVWAEELPSVAALDKLLGQRGATEMRRREQVSTNVTKWFELSNKYEDRPEVLDKFFQVANLTTVYQVDPLQASVQAVLKKPKDKMTPFDKVSYDIVREYNSLPADLRKAYKDLREDYEDKSRQLFKLMEQRLGKDVVDRLKAKYDSKRLQVYLPLWRKGDYWLSYTDKNGETIVAAYASDVDRQRGEEAAKAQGGKDFASFSRLNEARRNGPPPTGFLGDVVREMEAKGAPADMIDAVYETFLNYLPAESIRQMYRPREASFDIKTGVDRYGVFGFEPDVFQAYSNVATRMANQLTNLEYAIPLEETMREIRAQAGGSRPRSQTLGAVYNNLKSQVDFIRNPEKNWLIDGASYFSYLWFIAGNISSALINTTQLPMVVYPLLSGKYGYGKTFEAVERAISLYANGGWDTNNAGKGAFPSDFTFGAGKNLKSEYKKLYDAAVSRSVIRRSTGYEITELQKTGVKDYVGIKARVTHGLGWIFQNSERLNREVTLIAAFDLAYEKTKNVDKAIEEAIKIVNDAHGSALAETGPRLFQQGFGKVMFTFKRFAQAQIYLLSKLFNQAFKDADPATREVARSQLIGIFGSSFLIAGLQGMPLYGAVEFLANLLMGDDDEPYDFNAYVNSKFGETGRKGLLNQMIGVDVASRTGFNGLIWRDDPKRMAEVGPFLYALEQAMGPAYGAFLSGQRGYELFTEGEYQRSIEAITPSFIRNGFKALRMAEEGVRNKDGTPVVENISDYNLMMQVIGFNPAEVAEARERAGVDVKIKDKLIKRRSALIDQFYAAWQEDDQEELDAVIKKIEDFSTKNPYPGLLITPDTLYKSIVNRQKQQYLSVDGLYMPLPLRYRVDEITQWGG